MKWINICIVLFIVGCSSSDYSTDLREYSINNLHTVVGVGEWRGDTFVIQSHDGQQWDIPKDVVIYESAVTLESFSRVTK